MGHVEPLMQTAVSPEVARPLAIGQAVSGRDQSIWMQAQVIVYKTILRRYNFPSSNDGRVTKLRMTALVLWGG